MNAAIKLSAAIREGAKLRPQGHGPVLDQERSDYIGAAAEAISPQINFNTRWNNICEAEGLIELLYGIELSRMGHCPRCYRTQNLWHVLICLYHNHFYSREQIADWLQEQGL